MFKTVTLWLHKWLGIITGVVVTILSLTGCIYTFQDELKLVAYPEKYFISGTTGHPTIPLPLSTLLHYAQKSLPKDEKITRVDLYPTKNRTWVFRAVKTDEKAFGHWNYYKYYKRVFVNPYSGQVQHVENSKTEFFQLTLQLHLNLLLGKRFGHPIVAWSTAIFILILLSGIVLWWPKKWKGKNLKRSFSLDTKVKWKRLNHDLHNVIGFYSLFIGLIFAITGLAFAFPGFKKSYIATFNVLQSTTASSGRISPVPLPTAENQFQDNALRYALTNYPTAEMMSIRLKKDTQTGMDIQVRHDEKRSGVFDWLYFDRRGNNLYEIKSSEQLHYGDKLGALNYDIHTGSIGNISTKIIACLASLCCASLPITGYIIWMNKSKKKKKKRYQHNVNKYC
ncbi:PepSY domain-containing protein [Sphingobacterium sp. 2149]|uniref:PepSY-associated TM helix domain-containing protein n=1 Tax=Sphingobacterium sp. 2149 TaxID=2817763 RepID=UPI001AE3B85F|nr:PepSY domain-containing protein [Sphingobacterium sp. 2149]MDR6735164.1 putative iron-regulated membrane protein [Sphingobacterium sp. 2149]